MASCASWAETARVLYLGGSAGRKSFPIPSSMILAGFRLGNFGHIGRIGAHVGDQTGRAALTHIEAFVELLRQDHRPPGGVAQLARGFLLQGAGDEWRGGFAPALAPLDLADEYTRLFSSSSSIGSTIFLVPQDRVLIVDLGQFRLESLLRSLAA